MTIEPRLDIIGAALADPSRSRILCELMDGRAFTNKELASAARVTPQTASAHLKQLELAGLTASLRSGRHVYHRIANDEVAEVLEGLANLSPTKHLTQNGHKASDTMLARSCYNHIAGRLGVLMAERMIALNVLSIKIDHIELGSRCPAFMDDLGVKISDVGANKPIVKSCLDWTERRFHISGPLATSIMDRTLNEGWLERRTGSRVLSISADGYQKFESKFGLTKSALLSGI